MRVCKAFEFDAAHFLPGYQGKCANIHGHRWVVEIEVQGEPSKETGMVLDFTVLKAAVTPLIETLDHHLVNDTLPVPTAENITIWFKNNLRERGLMVTRVKVYETPTSFAEWRIEDAGL